MLNRHSQLAMKKALRCTWETMELTANKRPGQHIFLKVSREGYAGRGHPACCVSVTVSS
jgi:hypothetical protein